MNVKGSRRIIWAVLAATVLSVAIIVLATSGLGSGSQPSSPVLPGRSADPSPTPAPTTTDSMLVDPTVSERGWVPEPITQEPEAYARSALEAAGTFDTRLTSRAEWVEWLETWFTPSPLYDNEQDALEQMARYKTELAQAVVLPQTDWDDLASEDGRVSSRVTGQIQYLDLPETTQKSVWTATADVVLSFMRSADGEEVSYDETVRVSVQVVCGGESVPVPGSSQRQGDCKVVRFFDQAVD